MDTLTASRPAVYQEIPIDQIGPAPHQARKDFDPEALKSLADSMKEEGLIEPIVVRARNEHRVASTEDSVLGAQCWQLVSGERRLRAAKLLGWQVIDAKIIQIVNEAEATAMGLAENLHRQDLNPIEEAEGFQTLNQLDLAYWTQDKIAQVAGKSQTYVSRSSGLMSLPEEVKDNMRRRIISRDHGIELLRLSDSAKQSQVAKEIIDKDLSRGETRKLVDQMLGKGKTAKTPAPALPSSPATPTPTPIDPLADVWPPLQANPGITSEVHWEVKYGSHKLANAQAVNGWFFFVMPGPASTPQPTLAAWFTQIGQALKGSKLEAVIPQAAVEMQQAEHSLMGTFKPRLPQTPEEEKELLEIAIKAGPKGLSAWIYGSDSQMAKAVPAATWEELGMTPADGLRQVLDGIKKFQGAGV